MSTIQNLFEQAQLAEAAYANFINPNTNAVYIKDADIQAALMASGFSKDPNDPTQSAQAAAFAADWSVISQQPNTGSGFSGTVFKNNVTGEYVFAVRGSEANLTDWGPTNLGDIGSDGIAISQGIDMFNYYQRLIGAPNTPVAQYKYIPSLHPADPAEPPQIVRIADVTATGELSAQPSITAVGHSLGGHLAMMLSRMTNHVSSVTTLNAPGFDSVLGVVTYPLTSEGFFSLLGTTTGLTFMTNGWSTATMTHLDVQGDVVHTIGTTPGSSQAIFTEQIDQGWYDAHLAPSITDSLAVYNLLAKIDPTLDTAPNGLSTITDILKASSNIADRSLESAIAALGKVFMVPSASYVDATNGFNTDRNLLYVALTDIQAKLQSGYSIVSLVGQDAATLTTNAQGDIAYRFALVNSMPFVVTGADYNTPNAFGEFDVYDPTTGQGTLTNAYLVDRAAYLVAKLSDNTSDSTINTLQDVRYEDRYTSTLLNPTNTETRRVIFGSTLDENLSGATGNDSLFGGTGADTLTGNGGADYLEGGAGFDTYISNTGDGGDTILDTDGIGIIKHNGLTLSGGENVAPNRWEDAQGNSYFLSDTPSGTQNLLIQMGSEQITVNNYHSGQLGITLNGEVAPTAFTQAGNGITVQGDRAPYTMPWDYWLWVNFSATWPYLFDSNGNIVRTSTPQPFFADKIFDTAGDDKLYAGDGLNVIYAYSGGNNHIVTGGNDDYIVGGAGRDRVYAGGMTDTIDVAAGDDIVYGEGKADVMSSALGRGWILWWAVRVRMQSAAAMATTSYMRITPSLGAIRSSIAG